MAWAPSKELMTPDEESVHGLTSTEVHILGEKAIAAKALAYCPYSLFRVGASLLATDGTIIMGANVENGSYPVGICAERTAMSTAVIQGYKLGSFKAVAVATDVTPASSPCGMCRQFLREFCEPPTPILMFDRDGKYEVMTMGELLPNAFGPDSLPSRDKMEELNKEKKA
ncbi:cytidine deaminase [Pseudovirgaria hyperparasitica]|uniref:Cytidine deaminase n=1 Tax=Pseudovirgaria hyperparasitica TaxID=470096 RepID=A0A6A6W3F6_9PEZI|nr:cytidine deaminase [Pseudovirgaria hyperparasitica]KAF2756669.1 cytidine deaminase [Pseudovirgaria hyperparasitica]